MKNLLKIVSIIGLTVITQTAYSAAVTDTFTTGDTLTAEKLNNIKAAVNDNDTRISDIVLTPGPAGADGNDGAAGTDGTNGIAGAAGNDGAAGTDGTNGIAGAAGNDGAAGTDGTNGIAGADGNDGAQGPAGLGAISFHLPPTDTDYNYTLGTVWIDTTATAVYILADKTVGAAVWINMAGAAAAVTYAIGDDGPAGGKVFYVTNGGLHGLEAAPVDQSDAAEWGCFENNVTGAVGTAIGTGAQNTDAIVSFDGCDDGSPAALAATGYSLNGYDDWFLPSKDELNLMWKNLADPDDDGRESGSDSDSVGGFDSFGYLSSSQYDDITASGQHFGDGDQYDNFGKDAGPFRVRAVRAF
jgi:hypothetical protein